MLKKNGPAEKACQPSLQDMFDTLGAHPAGLTAAEVIQRQLAYGKNRLQETQGKPPVLLFLSKFTGLMAILLWVGGLIALTADMPELGIAIWLVNIINGAFSFLQEYRAGKATEALKNILPSCARVIRDGNEQKILAEELVPGDIMLVEEGDKISADACLFSSSDLQINQSTLTGESNPVRKNHETPSKENISPLEARHLIFAGTAVSSGTGRAIVTRIGMETEFGKIAGLTQSVQDVKSPLQNELDRLARQISLIALAIGFSFFLVAVFFVQRPLQQAFLFALGMVVAFIPEGLLPTVTLSLAMSVQRMARKNALVKRLSAVETLGATSVICSDKTGTLTENEMTVSRLWLPESRFTVSGLGYAPHGKILQNDTSVMAAHHVDLQRLLTGAALCSNARIVSPCENNPRYTVLGDPTEACLCVVAQKAGIDLAAEEKNTPRVRELPFDSGRKRMTTVHQLPASEEAAVYIAYVKGAPREMLAVCSSIQINNQTSRITDMQREAIMAANDGYAREGLRVLAIACRSLDRASGLPNDVCAYTPEQVERELTFLGLIAMADPPRSGVAEAVALCHKANIRIIMITGDYGLTAESVAKRIGIVRSSHPRIITGQELEEMDDDALKQVLAHEVIFARMEPEQKYRIVCALQEMGKIVAVTGDGVNDSPALKKADIGIAMGISGTDVAKEAADMILIDDNFASIVKAVEEGRTVYNNIRKFLLYIFNSNMAEAVPSIAFLVSRGAIPLPLTVMQILAVDLGTDILPALGLGTEMPEENIMNQPPRSKTAPLLNRAVIIKAFFWYGLMTSLFSMAAYFFVNWLHGWPYVPLANEGVIYREATTMTLGAIIFSQVGTALNCRTNQQSLFHIGLFGNRRILFGIVIEILLLCVLAYLPFLQNIFNTAPIRPAGWLFLICIPFPVVLLEELRKWHHRKTLTKKEKTGD